SDKTGILLTVSDDGIGIVPNEEGEDKDHFGLRLVRSLSEKLGGEPIVEGENGVTVSIRILNFKKVPHA
ncbi:MAG: hypothetical protein LPK80_04685, partial [Bacteroidota bacterium]|nr:hypothetical protein [Bacteroidota bacterium]